MFSKSLALEKFRLPVVSSLSVRDKTQLINIALVMLSAAVAYVSPVELFLFSYAVLGPLHYLTEISWLHDRSYFSKKSGAHFYLLGPIVIATLPYFFKFTSNLILEMGVACGLSLAFGLAAFKKKGNILLAGIFGTGLILFLNRAVGTELFFILFLPTFIHVYFFTWVFMAQGALREKNLFGHICLALFTLFPVIFLFNWGAFTTGIENSYFKDTFKPFTLLVLKAAELIGGNDKEHILTVLRFMAFAYTYHYLNWFSKTQVIRWHEIPKSRAISIGILYLLSVSIYAYDYSLGLKVLGILSLGHVFLEFPLNFISMKTLWRQVV